MFAFIAAVLFGVAFVLNGAGSHTSVWLSPVSLMLAGLVCVALHLAGVGDGVRITRR